MAMATAPDDGPLAGGPKKQADEQTHGLEKVTDYVEEKEEAPELGQAISNVIAKENEDRRKMEMELAKVVIKKEEVELIMRELEISKSASERALREHKGNLIKALHSLTD